MIFFFVLLAVGIVLDVIRLFVGPTTGDRVAALDALNVTVTGGIALFALYTRRAFYIDVAIIYGALSFVETIIIARFLEARE